MNRLALKPLGIVRYFRCAPRILFFAALALSLWGQETASEQVVPLILEGNGWTQAIEISNIDGDRPSVGEIMFYRTDGAPWEIELHGRGHAQAFSFNLQPNETIVFETVAHNDGKKVGWASVRSYSGRLRVESRLSKRLPYRLHLRCSFVAAREEDNKAQLYFDNAENRESRLGIALPVDACRGECAISCDIGRE